MPTRLMAHTRAAWTDKNGNEFGNKFGNELGNELGNEFGDEFGNEFGNSSVMRPALIVWVISVCDRFPCYIIACLKELLARHSGVNPSPSALEVQLSGDVGFMQLFPKHLVKALFCHNL